MNLILGVGGGIAAYKAAELARLLQDRGFTVNVVMTESAREFVQPLTFAALTGRRVITGLFDQTSPEGTLSSSVEHIGVAQENEVLLVAPATAGILAKFAHGLADDFLSTTYLAFTGRVFLAPAMNTNMWNHPATRANLETLRARGHVILDPEAGRLACGVIGPGRLADPRYIADQVALVQVQDLAGETLLITAGPTREAIDPVRYISNRSSGKMGYALAAAAARRGARVMLISGPVQLPAPTGVEVIPVLTAGEMYTAVMERLEGATIVIKSAAVADYRVANVAGQKLKKTGEPVTLTLEPNADILAEVGRRKGDRFVVGFAAETEKLLEYARRKLESKQADVIVANLVNSATTGFDSDQNEVTLVTRAGDLPLGQAAKSELAEQILTHILRLKAAR
ncbi:MAG: bifunctional phosphopantothenoylcysteine decarboxylase/phosphopantothenate--cysteine ligase CoaBC [Bryobacteraceae bacterium]|nr:bifunctional phosphopantothenoylcysteine decarboxylase/phosphopantothenate--cysteine ligase CoaBC [Bryobacteraceae bacterium]